LNNTWLVGFVTIMNSRLRDVLRLVKRSLAAKRFGFFFTGISRFSTPSHLKLAGKEIQLFCPPEAGIAKDVVNVLLDDEYRITRLKERPKTVVDIGANIGLFTLWSAANFRGATVHAYEPNSDLWSYTQANLSQVGASLYREGVSNKSGRGSVSYSSESRLGKCEITTAGPVAITAFREVLARMGGGIDLLKLDCEGAEWEILNDANSLSAVRHVVMEYHLVGGEHSVEELVAIFVAQGFSPTYVKPNSGFGIACFSRAKS